MDNRPIKTAIAPGDEYADEPIYIRQRRLSAIESAVMELCKTRAAPAFVVGYKRVKLNWRKPRKDM